MGSFLMFSAKSEKKSAHYCTPVNDEEQIGMEGQKGIPDRTFDNCFE